jgi:capsular polysaccharide biosynthesis protein
MTPQRFLSVLRRRSLIIWCVIAAGLGLLFSFRNAIPASFTGVSHVVLVAENGARDPSVSIVDLPSIATSTVVLQRVRQSLHLPMSLINLKANVSASVLGRSSIMAIGFRDASAERAIGVSNAVSDELSRLSTELSAEATKLHGMDDAMSSVVAKNPYAVSDKSIDNLTNQLGLLSVQRAEALAQLQGDQALAATTTPDTQLSKTVRHEILQSDPAYLNVRSIAAKDQAQLASDRAGYTSSFPGLPGAEAKVVSEMAAADDAAAQALANPDAYSPSAAGTAAQHEHQLALIAGDQARIKQLDAVIAGQRSNLDDVPTTGATYDQLRAQRDAVQTEYTQLATRRANALANRAEASSLGSVVVLDRAIKADTQLASGRTRAATMALILILALAIGAAFLVESLDPRIRRAEEIEELYGIPVVANFGSKS